MGLVVEDELRTTRRLVQAIQDLSLARSVEQIREVVRVAARALTGADGATFILRDGDRCHYVDEDAIAPLWKGRKFPADACVSGWAMRERTTVAIEDIYADARVPADAYRPTFVQSLAMVPIRTANPIGAIGNYWARRHRPSADELAVLQALADSTSVAMENVYIVETLERRVDARTEELARANRELEAFSYAASHDLRAPVRTIRGYAQALLDDHGAALPPAAADDLARIVRLGDRMGSLVDDLLQLSRVAHGELQRARVDLGELAREIVSDLGAAAAAATVARTVDVRIDGNLSAACDGRLVRIVLENLLGNAWKFTRHNASARIEFGAREREDGTRVFFVRDDGAGFDPREAERLFVPFQRLHGADEFEGTGVGLATAQRIVARHRGRIWADGEPGKGATFYFTLGA